MTALPKNPADESGAPLVRIDPTDVSAVGRCCTDNVLGEPMRGPKATSEATAIGLEYAGRLGENSDPYGGVQTRRSEPDVGIVPSAVSSARLQRALPTSSWLPKA